MRHGNRRADALRAMREVQYERLRRGKVAKIRGTLSVADADGKFHEVGKVTTLQMIAKPAEPPTSVTLPQIREAITAVKTKPRKTPQSRILQGAREALAYAKGEAKPRKTKRKRKAK